MSNRKSTYDFVRETHRDKYFAAREREIAMLADKNGGIKDEYAEPVLKCPICGETGFEFLFTKQNFKFKRCTNQKQCGHIFSDPQINEDALMRSYRGNGKLDSQKEPLANDLWMDVLLSQTNVEYDRTKYQRGIDAMQKALGTDKPGRILDIGCSTGHFLSLAKDAGWETVGLELNEKARVHAVNKLGLDVRPQLLNEAGFEPESFDVVSFWGVIEHLKKPVETFVQAVRVLKPGGVLLTFCPNGASLVCRTLREKAATFDGRNHPSYFTPKSVRLAMKLAGLKNLSITFHQPDIDAVLNYIEGRNPYVKNIDVKSPLHEVFSGAMKETAEKFILENEYGYKMMTVNIKTA